MVDKKKTPAPVKAKKPAPKPVSAKGSAVASPAPKPVKQVKPAPKPVKPVQKTIQKQPVKSSKPAPKPVFAKGSTVASPAPKPIAKPAPAPAPKPIAKPAPKPASAPATKPVATPAPKPEHKGPKVGDMAPDFTLQDQFGAEVKLSDLRGKKVLLSFHPLAWTPICELQMRTLELKKKALDELNTVPLGISVDSMYSKREWATFMELDQVQILADFWPHGEVAKKYGQFIDKKGISGRVNILIDETGKIAWIKIYDIPQLPDIEEVLAIIRSKSAKKK